RTTTTRAPRRWRAGARWGERGRGGAGGAWSSLSRRCSTMPRETLIRNNGDAGARSRLAPWWARGTGAAGTARPWMRPVAPVLRSTASVDVRRHGQQASTRLGAVEAQLHRLERRRLDVAQRMAGL